MNKPDRTPVEPFGGTARKRASYLSRAVQSARNLASRLISMCPVRFSLSAGFTSRAQLGQTQVRRSASQSETQVPGLNIVVDPLCPPDRIFILDPAAMGEEYEGDPKLAIVSASLNNVVGRDFGCRDGHEPRRGDTWLDVVTGDLWDYDGVAWILRNEKHLDLDEEFGKMLRERGVA